MTSSAQTEPLTLLEQLVLQALAVTPLLCGRHCWRSQERWYSWRRWCCKRWR